MGMAGVMITASMAARKTARQSASRTRISPPLLCSAGSRGAESVAASPAPLPLPDTSLLATGASSPAPATASVSDVGWLWLCEEAEDTKSFSVGANLLSVSRADILSGCDRSLSECFLCGQTG